MDVPKDGNGGSTENQTEDGKEADVHVDHGSFVSRKVFVVVE